MAFNGSGTLHRLYSWVRGAQNNINIDATRMDAEFNGIATALSDCVTRDGQSPATANLPMGTFKLTGLGNGNVATDSATFGQLSSAIQTGQVFRKNLLLNGSFRVWQRGTSFTLGAVAKTTTADRWQAGRTGAVTGESVSQQAGPPGPPQFKFCLRVQRVNADASLANVIATQGLETFDSLPLAGKTLTHGFWARCGANFSAAGSTLTARVVYGTGTDESPLTGYNGSVHC